MVMSYVKILTKFMMLWISYTSSLCDFLFAAKQCRCSCFLAKTKMRCFADVAAVNVMCQDPRRPKYDAVCTRGIFFSLETNGKRQNEKRGKGGVVVDIKKWAGRQQ